MAAVPSTVTAMTTEAAAPTLKTDCLLCPVRSCLVHRDGGEQAQAWSDMLAPRQALMPGDGALQRAGDRLEALYSVRGGCVKTYTVDAAGHERIRGFYFPGDLIGLDAIGGGICLSTAVAVVPSQVCVAPLAELQGLMGRMPMVAMRVMEQTSRELAMSLAIAGDYTAEQRLAAFLLQLRDRIGLGLSGCLRLPMAQRDVGNYLRLANETVCRSLKRFEQKGWLKATERGLKLLDEAALRAAAAPVGLEVPATPRMIQGAIRRAA